MEMWLGGVGVVVVESRQPLEAARLAEGSEHEGRKLDIEMSGSAKVRLLTVCMALNVPVRFLCYSWLTLGEIRACRLAECRALVL